MSTLLSVIIPAYNCEKTVALTINAVLRQNYQPIEIIVVDDGSTDKTAEIIRAYTQVKYVYQNNSGPATARNRGAKEALGEILLFTDSDCVPHDNWARRLFESMKEKKVYVAAGSYGIANANHVLARCIHAEIIYRHHHLMSEYPKAFGSYNVAVDRKAFFSVGGFDESYRKASGEDNDLSYKLLKQGYKILFVKDALVDHHHTTIVGKYLFEQYRHGFWRAKMYFDHPDMTRGDDYTFWKDIVEIPMSAITLVAVVLTPFVPIIGKSTMIVFLFFILMEIFFASRMTKNIFESIYYAFVMFLRAFWRSYGLSTGFLVNSLKIVEKNPN